MVKGYTVNEGIRASVVKSLPLIMEIQNGDLREKVIDAWAVSLSENDFNRLEDVSVLPELSQYCDLPRHITAVAKMSLALSGILDEALSEPLHLDRDLLLACALCHDLGNPYEYNLTKRAQWEADPRKEGFPCLRHTFYGAHIALAAGLPEAVAHACACHSPEGQFVKRSLGTTVLACIDEAFWKVVKSAHNLV